MQIECLLNPGVFRYDGKVWMLVRVAERPAQAEGEVSFPLLDAQNRVRDRRLPRHADRDAVLPDLYGRLGQRRGGADAQHVGLAPFHRLRAGAAPAQ